MALMGIRDAAEELDISHSTLSRYVKKYPDLKHPYGKRFRVDLDEVIAHRNANITVAEQQVRFGETGMPEPKAPRKPEDDSAAVLQRQRQSEAKATTEEYKAKNAELDYRKRVGEIVEIEDVEHVLTSAGAVLQNRMGTRVRELAERLAATADVHEIEQLLRKSDAALLLAFKEQLEALAAKADAEFAEAA